MSDDTAAYLEELAATLASFGSNLAALRMAEFEKRVAPEPPAPSVPAQPQVTMGGDVTPAGTVGAVARQYTGGLVVVGCGDSTARIISATTMTPVAVITLGGAATMVAATPETGYGFFAYVGSAGDGSIISTASFVRAGVLTANAYGIAITPDGAYAWCTAPASNSVFYFDTASHSLVSSVALGAVPCGIAITPDGTCAYVVAGQSVKVILLSTLAVVATISLPSDGSYPYGIAITPDGTRAYVSDIAGGKNRVWCISTATNAITATISTAGFGTEPYGLRVSPDGAYVWAAFRGSDTIGAIRTSDNAPVFDVAVGDGPVDLAITADGAYIWVTNYIAGTVSVVRTSDRTVTRTITVGANPHGIAIAGA